MVFMDIEVQFGKIVRFWRWWWWVLSNVNVLNTTVGSKMVKKINFVF